MEVKEILAPESLPNLSSTSCCLPKTGSPMSDSSEEDCKSRDSLNHDSEDDDSIENNPKNDDSLKDGQNFVDLNRDEFETEPLLELPTWR
jgi:hypothetical protein